MKTVAFFNNKDGVGKTTLVYHLAAMIADQGATVLAVDLDPRVEVRQPIVAVALHRLADGRKILDVNTQGDGVTLEKLADPTCVALCLEPLDLEPGAYRVDVGVFEARWSYVYDYHWQAYELEVQADRAAPGPPRRWSVER